MVANSLDRGFPCAKVFYGLLLSFEVCGVFSRFFGGAIFIETLPLF
jgi:hypothetical protein